MRKLLLADDSVTIQRVIELTFSGEDVQVIAVGDGEQAIARMPTDLPDIVLADIGMPKRSGYEVAAFIKGHPEFKHIPVLLLAGAFEPVDEAKAGAAGCDGVLVKPFEPQHVIARVRELLDGAKVIPAQAATPTAAGPVEKPTRASGPDPRVAGGERADEPPHHVARRDSSAVSRRPAMAPAAADRGDAGLGVPTPDKVLSRGRPSSGSPGKGQPAAPKTVPPTDAPTDHPPGALPPLPTMAPAGESPDTTPTIAAAAASGGSNVAVGSSVASGPHAASGAGQRHPSRNLIADAFTALLALEQGEPGARPVRLTTGPEQPAVTDALVDEVVRKVLDRLAPDAARAVVAEVVSEVAERLVRDEIARIRNRQ